MRILMVHNRYLQRGGEDESCEREIRLLENHGHLTTSYIEDNRRVADIGKAAAWFRTIWSAESYGKIRAKIRHFHPDVVDVNNFFPLVSPAVFYAAHAEKVPVVQRLHNYRLICPNAYFFDAGRICEACAGKLFAWPGIVNACYRGSRAGAAAVASMVAVHRLLGTWKNKVSRYVALTEFARGKFVEAGFPAERLRVKPNFVHPDPGPGEGRGGFALFVGRLSEEKGIRTLLAAWREVRGKIPLKIVGDGPMAGEVEALLPSTPGVEWLGRKPVDEALALMGQAAFLVMPSEWYEGLPLTILEAYAKGLPVLAGRIGAMSSLIRDGHTGLHFQPGNPLDLAAKAQWLFSHPAELARMRRAAREEFETKFAGESNNRIMMEIYAEAVREKTASL